LQHHPVAVESLALARMAVPRSNGGGDVCLVDTASPTCVRVG
jgi:hypothetical protein